MIEDERSFTQTRGALVEGDETVTTRSVSVRELINDIPLSTENRTSNALLRARELIAGASRRAADLSKGLALQPENSACTNLFADLAAIWRVQAQLVTDIGTVFGKSGKLTEDSIIYCLFRHAAAQFACEIVTGLGERLIGERGPRQRRGTEIVPRQRSSRLLPVIGAVAVAAYAYYDTDRIGQHAIEFFSKEIDLG
jgi:hypothetical protein